MIPKTKFKPRNVRYACRAERHYGSGRALRYGARLFLRGIVEADPNDLAFWDQLGCQADDRPPEGPALVVEGAPEGRHRSVKSA